LGMRTQIFSMLWPLRDTGRMWSVKLWIPLVEWLLITQRKCTFLPGF
jgi:hypothetical protein